VLVACVLGSSLMSSSSDSDSDSGGSAGLVATGLGAAGGPINRAPEDDVVALWWLVKNSGGRAMLLPAGRTSEEDLLTLRVAFCCF
jgi:hypothetical protein